MSIASFPHRGGAPLGTMRTRGRRSGATNALWFTELLILAALSIGYLLAMGVPLFGLHLQISSLKHVPMILLLPAMLLQLAASRLQAGPNRHPGLWSVTWPLTLLAAYATAGSMVARWQLEVDETFLVFGAYMFLVPALALCVRDGREAAWAKGLSFLVVASSLAALAGAMARFSTKETLHEIEYIVLSCFVLAFYSTKSRVLKVGVIVLMLGAAAFNQKLTGYIIAVMALIYIAMKAGWRATSPPWRSFFSIAAVTSALVIIAGLVIGYFEFRQYLPSGNDVVRLKQYEQAWNQFLASPLWGNGFTGGSGEMYREHNRLLNIPTHSDLLDMLKHGGAIGLGLFLLGYFKLIALFTRAIGVVQQDRRLHAYFTWIRFFMVTALVTFAINPLLLKAPYAVVIWSNVGLALGVALHVLQRARSADAERPDDVLPHLASPTRRPVGMRGRPVPSKGRLA